MNRTLNNVLLVVTSVCLFFVGKQAVALPYYHPMYSGICLMGAIILMLLLGWLLVLRRGNDILARVGRVLYSAA